MLRNYGDINMRRFPQAKRRAPVAKSRRKAYIRGRLLERRKKLLESMTTEITSTLETSGHPLADMMDMATATMERETSLRIGSSESSEVEEIDRAIERLDCGKYGICEDCGGHISAPRLRAKPSASLCVKCKAKDERMHPSSDEVALNWHRFGTLPSEDGPSPEDIFGTIRGKRHL